MNVRFDCLPVLLSLVLVPLLEPLNPVWAWEDTRAEPSAAAPKWDIESAPGPGRTQNIETDEGTWISLDVSPDGQQIVFDLLGDLYVMPITGADGNQGQHPRKLTDGVAWDMQPRFSPDGRYVAFTSDRAGKSDKAGDNIWTIGVDGSQLRQITDESYRLLNGPVWSPDGHYIVARKHFSSRRSLGAGEMWMYHSAGAAADAMSGVQLTKRPNDQKDVNEPAFSPDGRYLYYSQDSTPGDVFQYDKDSNKQIYVVQRLDLEKGETETFISGPGGACRPTPSPDGQSIAFVRRMGARTGLHLMDIRSGAVRLLYADLERDMQEAWAIHGVYPNFAWTPDGQSIVIWAKGKIRRIQVDKGQAEIIPFHVKDRRITKAAVRFPVEVAPEQFDVKMLRWVTTSPQGDRVAYQALGHIYIRDLPDGEPQRLTQQETHFEFYPSFSRDGRYLVYTTWNDQLLGSVRIASVDPQAAENWVVTSDPGHYVDPVFSPDGKTVVYQKVGGGNLTSPLWSRDTGLFAVAARDGEPRQIAESGNRPQFAKSNDRVFFLKTDSNPEADNLQLCSMDLSGHEQRTHYTSTWATDFCISPTQDHIAFVERFHVYLAPFVSTGSPIQVGPQAKGLPVTRVSEEAGDWIHFSGDGRHLHWSLGPTFYSCDLDKSLTYLRVQDGPVEDGPVESNADAEDPVESDEEVEDAKSDLASQPIGFRRPFARPTGMVAIVGGRVITMRATEDNADESDTDEIIENGTVLIDGNRIVAVGPASTVSVPPDAYVIDARQRVVMPGLIDVHAHGPLASSGITPQQNWINFARLAFGVTTIHDPSNDTHSIFAASEMAKAAIITAPRTFSTGRILYGATGSFKAEIESLDDARFHLRRMQAVGAFTVKSYNQPRRDQRQQVLAAARELKMMVVPEGGSTFMHNMTMIVDGHTGIEHTLPVQTAYDDVMDLWRGTDVGYTPTLNVAYGGISGEQYWYQHDDLWLHPRLQTFIPPHVLVPRSRRRDKSPEEDYNHIRVAEIARQVVEQGGLVQTGGHGQLPGICTHWEMWSFVQGGMTPLQALRCGTWNGAKYLGLDADLGSLEPGKLADLIILRPGADPTRNIRDTEKIERVVANGRVFDADRMNEHGSPEPRRPFFWNGQAGQSVQTTIHQGVGCGCLRPGCLVP